MLSHSAPGPWVDAAHQHDDESDASWGFLDAEHVVAKPANTRRILVLGDSFVEAAQVAIEQKFTQRLQKRLSTTPASMKYFVQR